MIDLRSDTVTTPCPAMCKAMMRASLGDDVDGDNLTINALQEYIAYLSGNDAVLFLPAGTQTNLVTLLSHCEHSDEVIVGQMVHNDLYQAGDDSIQSVDADRDGTRLLNIVADKINPGGIDFAHIHLLSLKNTHHGRVQPRDSLHQDGTFTHYRGLVPYVDSVRLFNAVVEYGCELKTITHYCDASTLCLSTSLEHRLAQCWWAERRLYPPRQTMAQNDRRW